MIQCRIACTTWRVICCHETILFFVLLLLAACISEMGVTAQGFGSALRDRWSLPEDGPATIEFDNDEAEGGLHFYFEFPISRDVATHDNIDVSYYDQGCRYNDGDPRVELFKGTREQVTFEGTQATVLAGLDMQLGTLETNLASMLGEYPTLWDASNNRITFCVRFSLVTEDIEVNFLETVVAVDVSLEAGFKILDVKVAPKERIVSIGRVTYDVRAYLCGGNYQPLEEETTGLIEQLYEICDEKNRIHTSTTNTTIVGQTYEQELSDAQKVEPANIVYPQGSVVRVCIRPDDTVYGQVSMRTIDALVFEGTYNEWIAPSLVAISPLTTMSDGVYSQYAVQDGSTDISHGLSYMSCEADRWKGHKGVIVCAVDTVLVAAFYWRTPGQVAKVTAYGLATLKFGGPDEAPTRERNLRPDPKQQEQQQEQQEQQQEQQQQQQQQQQMLPPLPPGEELPRPDSRRNAEVDLDVYWNMVRPKVDYSRMEEDGGFDFDMEYILSDGISNDMIRLEVWTKDCEQPDEEPFLVYPSSTTSDLLELTATKAYETGTGSGTQTITVANRWKNEKTGFMTTLKDSGFYSENSDGTLVQISVCVRAQLHTKASNGNIEVNFLETPVILNIDLEAGIDFALELRLVPSDDECLADLQKQSGGGMDTLYDNQLLWAPGTDSADPSMPMGPSRFASSSYSSRYGSSSLSSSSSFSSSSSSSSSFSSSSESGSYSWFSSGSGGRPNLTAAGTIARIQFGFWTVTIGSAVYLGIWGT